MKSNERLLKYLSGMMSPEESMRFEEDMKSSNELVSEYLRLKKHLSDMTPDMSLEEEPKYFVNLVPRARAGMQEKQPWILRAVRYAVPVMILIAIYILVPFRSSSVFEKEVSELSDSSQAELLNTIDESVALNDASEIETVIDDQFKNVDIEQISSKYVKTDDLLMNLSDEEINQIYNKILNKKIL